jgi:hypothetical protein
MKPYSKSSFIFRDMGHCVQDENVSITFYKSCTHFLNFKPNSVQVVKWYNTVII